MTSPIWASLPTDVNVVRRPNSPSGLRTCTFGCKSVVRNQVHATSEGRRKDTMSQASQRSACLSSQTRTEPPKRLIDELSSHLSIPDMDKCPFFRIERDEVEGYGFAVFNNEMDLAEIDNLYPLLFSGCDEYDWERGAVCLDLGRLH